MEKTKSQTESHINQQILAFVTSSDQKVNEFQRILKRAGSLYVVKKTNEKLDEPSNPKSLEALVRHKTIKAYKKYKMPILVEHTSLEIGHLYGLPGYATDYVTSKINNYAICELMRCTNNRHAVAKTLIGYCDGQKVHVFEGEVEGSISKMPLGENGFGWDSIFIPNDPKTRGKTFAQMTPIEKDSVSMRKKAIEAFVNHLCDNPLEYYKDSNKNLEDLLKVIQKKEDSHSLILFLGAGVSRNLGYVSWSELLLKMMKEMGYDAEIAATLTDDPLQLAEFCMQKSPASLNEIFNQTMGTQVDLSKKLFQSTVHRSLVKLNPKKIYTTNYENTIEKAYELFEEKNEAPIVKLHGDIKVLPVKSSETFEKEFNEKFVLTETSYLNAFDKIYKEEEPFKDLLADLKDPQNTFLFIGYGMGDMNIKYLIHKAKPEHHSGDSDEKKNSSCAELFFFTTKAEPVQETVLTSKGVKMIYGDDPDHKLALENFMFKLIEDIL